MTILALLTWGAKLLQHSLVERKGEKGRGAKHPRPSPPQLVLKIVGRGKVVQEEERVAEGK